MPRVDAFLDLLIKQGGSDLHLISGNAPRVRLLGEIHPVKYRELSENETLQLLKEIMPEHLRTAFEEHGGVDFAYEISEKSRFRVNAFRHIDGVGAVFRTIPTLVPSMEELKLPQVIKSLTRQRRGLILVTGPTGSGKTTTLASMIDQINRERHGHIITIEDPIEYVHINNQCLISQREVGLHTESFAEALHSALREDPDVILVGEMRDLETIGLAVTAAEMGILVLGTLHTNGAAAAVDRIINVFPPSDEPYIRTMLSTSLCGIISQHLLRTADNKDRIAAAEVLINNSATANIMREGKTEQLENVIQGGALQGMQAIDTVLRRYLDEKLITGNEAYRVAKNKAAFEQYREVADMANKTSMTNNQIGHV
ncbi:MAG: twitching motility protein [Gammaproteobacteria bacterium SG8_15]|nr:MAG: twitching motility protein [Gammaproteobacteria bacterium SG8_15]